MRVHRFDIPRFGLLCLNLCKIAPIQSGTVVQPRLGQPQPMLRVVSAVLLLSFLWSFTVAPMALAARPASPGLKAAKKKVTVPMTAAELARRSALAAKAAMRHPAKGNSRKNKSAVPSLAEMARRDNLRRQNLALNLAQHPVPPSTFPEPETLLNDIGKLAKPVTAAQVAAWKIELKTTQPAARRAATLHLWVGEYLLAHNEDPHGAAWHWRMTQQLLSHQLANASQKYALSTDPLYGLAAFDSAMATFNEGAYQQAADEFSRLNNLKTALSGYDRRSCALWLRHAGACAGYHADRARLGIPEPPRLDPLCGVAALATCLKSLSLPYDKHTLLKNCRVTGEGNNLRDLVAAGPKLGVTVRPLSATDEGLRALPMPLVAYIEHDHYVAVVRADKRGVSYLCSDCGAWPGGRVDLTWKQWHAVEPSLYASVNKPNSYWDQVLAAKQSEQKKQFDQGNQGGQEDSFSGFQVAAKLPSIGLFPNLIGGQPVMPFLPKMPNLRGVRMEWNLANTPSDCVSKVWSLRCPDCVICCFWDFLTGGFGGGGFGGGAGFGGGIGAGFGAGFPFGAGANDPVNLATGEEEYTPAADLTVYNPHGPSVSWSRIYDSLHAQTGFEDTDYGSGWSQTYNVGVSSGYGGPGGTCVIFSNGSNVPFTVPQQPTAGTPRVACTVQAGAPLLVEADYSSSGTYYTITFADRTRWITRVAGGQLAQIVDRNGNAINFNYANSLLSSITDNSNLPLLTVTRTGRGTIAAVSDRYGRSVYYHVGSYGAYSDQNGTELDYVSQVVPACSANPPARYIYGYQSLGNPSYSFKTSNFLHTISVPSPTGDGTLNTATINYGSDQFVSSLVDANNNQHIYQAVDSSGASSHNSNNTLVKYINGKTGKVDYSYTVGFDSHMSQVSRTDGAGRQTMQKVYSDPNNPYRPSAVLDGNASQSFPDPHMIPGGNLTLTPTTSQAPAANSNGWEIISPAGTIVATAAAPAGWAVNNYYTLKVTSPTNATPGNGYRVRTYIYGYPFSPGSALFDIIGNGSGYGTTSYTWDGYGNMTSQTSPRGTTTTNTYDYSSFPLGELTQTKEGSKTPTQYAYDHADGYTDGKGIFVPCGLLTAVASPTPGSASGSGAQVVSSYTYDLSGRGQQAMGSLGLGNLVSMTAPGNNATTTAGAPSNNPTITNGYDTGITTTFAYTGDGTGISSPSIGLPLAVTDNLGKTTHLRYDVQGQTVAVIDALGNETDTRYNEGGGSVSLGNQVQSVTLPATGQTGSGHGSTTVTYLYPGGPALASTVFNESGAAIRQVNTTYGKEGETLSVSGSTEPVAYTYDGLYRQSTLKDGGNHVTSYYYDAAGYLDTVTYPGYAGPTPAYNTGTGSWDNVSGADSLRYPSYDADGNVLSRVDGRGQTTTYTYNDPESALTNITYPSGTIGAVSFGYDGYGRRSAMSDGTGSQTYAYDDANDLTSKSVTWTGIAAKTFSYAFYPSGSRSGMSAAGQVFSYGYDKDGRMTGLVNPAGEQTAWAYRDNGWLQAKMLGNASSGTVATTAYTQNALGQVTDLLNQSGTGTTLSHFASMAYDGAGNRTSVTASLTGAPASYNGTTGYTYDYGQTANPALNRSQLTKEQSTRAGNYTNNFAYDGGTSTGPGNPTSFKGAAQTFNANNQQTGSGFGYDGNGNPTTYKNNALAFDPENRMTAYSTVQTDGYSGDGLRTWKQTGGVRTYFLYDGEQAIAEYSSAGAITAANTYGADGLVSRRSSSTTTFYTFDERGNVAQRFGSTGSLISSDLYDGYGSKTSTGGAAVLGFEAQAGYYTDTETGLILCTHRFYDPQNGRWLTRDPLGYAGGVNLYGYVGNNPINEMDSTGFLPMRGNPDDGKGSGLAGWLCRKFGWFCPPPPPPPPPPPIDILQRPGTRRIETGPNPIDNQYPPYGHWDPGPPRPYRPDSNDNHLNCQPGLSPGNTTTATVVVIIIVILFSPVFA